ncbi:unnamed protein product [Adineta steineri]|uniref:Uncharacterized protein n=1 Tax=Adineta steineri TaxID=433720 RepID=A0A814QLI4_9BILA|nr:unnamed protein product [Adineta steineri]
MFKLDSHSKIFIYLIDIFSKRYSYVGIGFSFKDIRMSGFNFRSMIFIHLENYINKKLNIINLMLFYLELDFHSSIFIRLDFLFDQRHSSTWISRLLIDIHPLGKLYILN